MIVLDRQHVRCQKCHPLHHYWLLKWGLSGFDLRGESLVDWQETAVPIDTVKNLKLSTYLVLSARSYPTEDPQCFKLNPTGGDGDVMFIEIVLEDDNSRKEEPKAGEQEVEYFNVFPTRSELAYHKYLMCGLIPLIFLRNPNIMEGFGPLNLKIPCNIGHEEKTNPRENANGGVSNFTGRINGMHVFVGNFTYIMDFMIIEDISSIIDLRLSQVVLGKPFVEISNMTQDPPKE
ncbi:hypothetical protein Tco_0193728 [Tanacetum coccineum]